jgi:hypothetical protein
MQQCVRPELREQGTRTTLFLPSKDQINFRPMNGEQFTGSLEHELSFGPFRLLPAQQILLEGESPVRVGSRATAIVAWQGKQALSPVVSRNRSIRLDPVREGLTGETQ